MPEYLSPGVYVEETGLSSRPLNLPKSSLWIMVGQCGAGLDRIFDVASSSDFWRMAPSAEVQLIDSVEGFFVNGGKKLHIVPVGALDGPSLTAAREQITDRFEHAFHPVVIAVPGLTDPGLQSAFAGWCKSARTAFLILDGERDFDSANYDPRGQIGACDFASLYQPWLQIGRGPNKRTTPPSGHVLGVMARTERERGIHKASAGRLVRGISGTASNIDHHDQSLLNPRGINAIRTFPSRGTLIWGARTLAATGGELRYVPSARLVTMLEAAMRGYLRGVSFEQNNAALWQEVSIACKNALNDLWRSGALSGSRQQDAYFARCGLRQTMTQSDLDHGLLICEIGVALVRPAEFTVMRFKHNMAR